LYPTLTVEGEEAKETTQHLDSCVDPKDTEKFKNLVSQEFLNNKHKDRADFLKQLRETYTPDEFQDSMFETFNTKDAVVWIDPLDGTSDFVKGNLPAVTVLIGLSVKGFSRAGIVHTVFTPEDQTKGRTVFGTAEQGAYKIYFDKEMSDEAILSRDIEYIEPFNHVEEPAEDHKIRVAASLSHFSKQIEEIINAIDPVEIVRLGGAGNKCCNLAYGNVDSYIHPSPGLKNWDLCAPESLIKAMGGYSTNLFQERLVYNQDSVKLKGLILGRNPRMYNLITKRMGELLETMKTTVKL